uniref:Uncharacterized protein n=1 Tax=Strongyloides venezuelensis TaxID=75913 RepID=A0A0K0F2Y9_STRVS
MISIVLKEIVVQLIILFLLEEESLLYPLFAIRPVSPGGTELDNPNISTADVSLDPKTPSVDAATEKNVPWKIHLISMYIVHV